MSSLKLDSPFLTYLVQNGVLSGDRLPTLAEISHEMGVSIGKLREEVGLARAWGLVSLRPRVGMQREPFDFAAIMLPAVLFGLSTGDITFQQLSQLRRGLETSLWQDAVQSLLPEDLRQLRALVAAAQAKLQAAQVEIPFAEHRDLHLTIFSRLQNPLVTGLLSVYWEAYQASEITRYNSYYYWVEVWSYHDAIVSALENQAFDQGRALLIEHFNLLPQSPLLMVRDGHHPTH